MSEIGRESGKTVTGRRRRPRRVPGVILHDFGAKMEVKSLQKGEKMRSKFEALPRTTIMPQMAKKCQRRSGKRELLPRPGSILGGKKEVKNHHKRRKKATENRHGLGTVSGGVSDDFWDEKRR